MEVVIEHLGAVQFEIKARGHAIVTDQPRENGGFDEGMTPPELLLASLGSCAAFYAAQYLRKHNLASEGTWVRVTAEKEKNPARLDRFRIEVEMPAVLDERHRAGGEAMGDEELGALVAEHVDQGVADADDVDAMVAVRHDVGRMLDGLRPGRLKLSGNS